MSYTVTIGLEEKPSEQDLEELSNWIQDRWVHLKSKLGGYSLETNNTKDCKFGGPVDMDCWDPELCGCQISSIRTKMTKLLLVEDDQSLADFVTQELVGSDITVIHHSDWDSAFNTFSTMGPFDIVLSDYDLRDPEERTGLDLLKTVGQNIYEVGCDPYLILYSGMKRDDIPDHIAFFEKHELSVLFTYIESIASG